MYRTKRLAVALSSVLVVLSLTAAESRAVEIECLCEDGSVRLSVPGLYYEASLERAETQDGPYIHLARGTFGCTEACEFLDSAVIEGTTYWYQMTAVPQLGPPIELGPVMVTTPALPQRMLRSIASPNPFREAVSVRFSVPAQLAAHGPVDLRVTILDASGRVVRELPTGAVLRGDQAVGWDGRDGEAREVPSGVYLYIVQAGAHMESGRIVKLH